MFNLFCSLFVLIGLLGYVQSIQLSQVFTGLNSNLGPSVNIPFASANTNIVISGFDRVGSNALASFALTPLGLNQQLGLGLKTDPLGLNGLDTTGFVQIDISQLQNIQSIQLTFNGLVASDQIVVLGSNLQGYIGNTLLTTSLLGVVDPVTGAVGGVVKGVYQGLRSTSQGAVLAVGSAATGLTGSLGSVLSTPVRAVTNAVGSLPIVGGLLGSLSGGNGGGLLSGLPLVGNLGNTVGGVLSGLPIVGGSLGASGGLLNGIFQKASASARRSLQSILGGSNGLLGGLLGNSNGLLSGLTGATGGLVGNVAQPIGGVVNNLGGVVNSGTNALGGNLAATTGTLGGIVSGTSNVLGTLPVVGGILGPLGNTVGGVVSNTVSPLAGNVVGSVGNLVGNTLATVGLGVGGLGSVITNLPQFAGNVVGNVGGLTGAVVGQLGEIFQRTITLDASVDNFNFISIKAGVGSVSLSSIVITLA